VSKQKHTKKKKNSRKQYLDRFWLYTITEPTVERPTSECTHKHTYTHMYSMSSYYLNYNQGQ